MPKTIRISDEAFGSLEAIAARTGSSVAEAFGELLASAATTDNSDHDARRAHHHALNETMSEERADPEDAIEHAETNAEDADDERQKGGRPNPLRRWATETRATTRKGQARRAT